MTRKKSKTFRPSNLDQSFNLDKGGMNSLSYGRLILLGTNGATTRPEVTKNGNRCLELYRRPIANGVSPGPVSFVQDSTKSEVVTNPSRHAVSYTFNRTNTVVVEYVPDPNIDLFQIGRYKSPIIDFHIGDVPSPTERSSLTTNGHGNGSFLERSRASIFFGMFDRSSPTPKKSLGSPSTVSRFACRIDIDRRHPHEARIYAAGFDTRNNIFLGENACKWRHSDIMDGFTTNGVRIFRPSQWLKRDSNDEEQSSLWREVSVCGNVYRLHSTMFVPGETDRVEEEDNVLEDGTLIDLCGAILIWRSAEGLRNGLTLTDVSEMINILNQLHIQCPVYLKTLQFKGFSGPRVPSKFTYNDNYSSNSSLSATFGGGSQPHVYLNCGHVHGYHDWRPIGEHTVGERDKRTCPLCRQSSRFVRLSIGEEVGFYVDRGAPSHCFNPCGHIASEATVRFWSTLKLLVTNQTPMMPKCPFCAHAVEGPPVRLIFQHRADESTLKAAFEAFNCTPLDSPSKAAPFVFTTQSSTSPSPVATPTAPEMADSDID
nr:protein pellino 1 [Hymenolepis microstoma]